MLATMIYTTNVMSLGKCSVTLYKDAVVVQGTNRYEIPLVSVYKPLNGNASKVEINGQKYTIIEITETHIVIK